MAAGDAINDAALVQRVTQSLAVVALIGMNFLGTTLERNGVNRFDEHFTIGCVGCRVQGRQRQTILVHHKVALRSR